MKQFWRVLQFSFASTVRTKSMIVSTVIMCVIIFGAMCVPTIINFVNDRKQADPLPEPGVTITPGEQPSDDPSAEEAKKTIVVSDKSGAYFTDEKALTELFPDYVWILDNSADVNELSARVEQDELHSALVITDIMNAEYITNTGINVFGGDISGVLQSHLTDTYRYELLMAYQVSTEDADRFFNIPMLRVTNVGIKSMVGQVQSMVFIMLLYIAILSSGQMVAMSVTQEKSSRAMEVLITTSRPETLMFGKVIGIGLVGLAQMLTFVLTAVAAYFVNQDALFSIDMLAEMFNIPLSTFAFAFLFFIGGYFFYAMLFAAIGSLVSRTEDLASANTPMTLLSVAGFMVAIYGQLYGFADSLFYKVLSYIPFTSPYVMLARVCAEPNMVQWEILISFVLLYISVALLGILSAKVYRIGVLIYGKRPTLKEVVAALKQ